MSMYAHRGRIRLSGAQLATLLGLPEDVEIVAVQGRFDPAAVDVLLMGPSISAVPVGAEAPILPWRVPQNPAPQEFLLEHCTRLGCDALRRTIGEDEHVLTTSDTPSHGHVWGLS